MSRGMRAFNPKAFNPERLLQVLLAPVVSEKTTFVAEKANQYVFKVAPDATKPEIKAAVELLFSGKEKKIQVTGVRVANVRGKHKRFGRGLGRRSNWKKAYVSLAPGQDISFQATE
jgi:large subunit ribosomal protein L23